MAPTRSDGGGDLVRDGPGDRGGGVDQVDGRAAVQAITRRIAGVDLHDAAQAAPVLRAVSARDEFYRAHEVRMDHRTKAAEVIEQRNAHAVDVDARVFRRSAPHHDLARACRRPRDTRQILDDFQHIPGGAGDAARLIGVDLRGHDLLGQSRRNDHDLEVVAVFVPSLVGRIELDLVRGIELLAGLEALFALQGFEIVA